jgi:hypothetical protein
VSQDAESHLISVVAAKDSDSQQRFAALERLANEVVGCKLFTAISWDVVGGTQRRLYTNRPDLFPQRGPKPIRKSDFSAQVIYGGQLHIANNAEALGKAFTTLDLIRAAGCEAGINIPIVSAGRTIGTINLLHEENYYTPARVAAAARLCMPALACFLLHAGSTNEDQNV